jgi:predicted outer membrane protein
VNRGAKSRQDTISSLDRSVLANRKGNDAAFLAETSDDLLLESQLAVVAIRRATSAEVKELAISVLTDHGIAMEELREIASRIDVPLMEKMSKGHRKQFVRNSKRTGTPI